MNVQSLKSSLSDALAYFLAGCFLLLPLAYIVMGLLTGRPWYATKTVTVTKTVHYGVLPEILPVVVIWLFALLIFFGMPYLPRGMQ